jgi:peptidoglycan hydrolase-like protein with peptidoglycan-binding domain
MGSNHIDVYHWFNKYGKTMDNVRKDVANLLNGATISTPTSSNPQQNTDLVLTRVLRKGSAGQDVKTVQEKLIKLGYDLGMWGADGDFGNMTYAAVVKFQ